MNNDAEERAAVAVLENPILRAIGNEHTQEGLTIRSIATRAGVSPALLYTYFTGKAALLREMQRLAEPRLETSMREQRSIVSVPVGGTS